MKLNTGIIYIPEKEVVYEIYTTKSNKNFIEYNKFNKVFIVYQESLGDRPYLSLGEFCFNAKRKIS